MKKKEFFELLDKHVPKEDWGLLTEWMKDYYVTKTNILPCPVEYVGNDPDGEQNDMPSVLTQHLSKLSEGRPLLAHLGVKVLFTPVRVTEGIKTVGDLKKAAVAIWPSAHPMNQADWNKFAVNQKGYFDLNKILKGLKEPIDLPDIREFIHFVDNEDESCTTLCRIDIKTGAIDHVSIDEMDYILCVAK